MFKLFKAFQKVMRRFEEEEERKHTIVRYDFTLPGEKNYLKEIIKQETTNIWNFERVFASCKDSIHCIFRFLALLELIQDQIIKIKIGEGINNFQIVEAEVI